MLAIRTVRLNLLNIFEIFINPSLSKITSNIKTLMTAEIELPKAIPICPRPN